MLDDFLTAEVIRSPSNGKRKAGNGQRISGPTDQPING